MPASPLLRRLITVPAVLLSFVLITALSPVLFAIALATDVVRKLAGGPSFVAVRILAFGWAYLLGEVWALAALGATAVLPLERKRRVTYRLQGNWASWNLRALRTIFSVDLDVSGQDTLTPGPLVLLVRHASIVDTLLPATLVARPLGMKLRYVLKRELLVDPALDIAGNRLPNHFITRGTGGSAAELDAIQSLSSGLTEDEGILIYPEGTRFSEEKRVRFIARFSEAGEPIASSVAGLRRVLPPRPRGTLGILSATTADVVVLVHRGLEGLATVADIWRGGLVGSNLDVAFWRIERPDIPTERQDRLEWLYRLWADVDSWVGGAPAVETETS